MNITEATHVARLLRILDGSYAGQTPDQLVESAAYLAPRTAKPLQVSINLRTGDLKDTVTHLLQRQADREVEINLNTGSEPTR